MTLVFTNAQSFIAVLMLLFSLQTTPHTAPASFAASAPAGLTCAGMFPVTVGQGATARRICMTATIAETIVTVTIKQAANDGNTIVLRGTVEQVAAWLMAMYQSSTFIVYADSSARAASTAWAGPNTLAQYPTNDCGKNYNLFLSLGLEGDDICVIGVVSQAVIKSQLDKLNKQLDQTQPLDMNAQGRIGLWDEVLANWYRFFTR